ncbi:hypothetical protein HDU98_007046 [Podochytrium sp. JEL0797]|nr:hypothetical protein HDU98_007046 [Podochytrium sp. JEL0797]
MGSVLGIQTEESPAYTVARTTQHYEVRRFSAQLLAETADADRSAAFRRLATYIGVLGTPANTKATHTNTPEAIAMTTPVMMTPAKEPEPIAMTSPVVMAQEKMSFILPASRYASLASVPVPTDPLVHIRELPPRTVAVLAFAGFATYESARPQAELLRAALVADKVVIRSDAFTLYGYNPPWTVPWLRKNEVSFEIEENPSQ